MPEQGPQFFHGTTHDIAGGVIRPANKLPDGKGMWGSMGHSGQRSDEHAFATTDESIAWQFGSQSGISARAKRAQVVKANENQGYEADLGIPPAYRQDGVQPVPEVGRVRVHTVAPNPRMKPGVYNRAHPNFRSDQVDLKEFVAPSFRSTGVIDTMPGRQGTFPNINWNQFASSKVDYAQDANHPDDESISDGHLMETRKGERFRRNSITGANRVYAPVEPERTPGRTGNDQLDLFSGRTVLDHVENDDSSIGDYHRNERFGRL